MADDDQYNDEYQFADLDEISSDSLGDDESTSAMDDNVSKKQAGKDIRRNALIVIALIIFAMLGYKFLGSFFSGKKSVVEKAKVPPITNPTPVVSVQPPAPQPIAPVQTSPTVVESSADHSEIKQKLSTLEMSEQDVRSEVNSVNKQLGDVNSNVNELTEKIASLNQIINALASKVDQQSSELARLTQRARPKPVRRVVSRGPSRPAYYIQAVIPGRAWLIAANGSTLTVREGTPIAGYGVVKLIDPNQGRVLTSSGQEIRFSQQDS